ncbi:MAG: cytochrome c biogenesis protein CcsA [Deltaproteobacteria bacterium]|nr:cytochrome c biogenesis protein CcsA [Deltaproteobacteria bacterium]
MRSKLATATISFAALTIIALGVAAYFVADAPIEARMGVVQKIFYFHVPAAFMMFVAVGVTFAASLLYLIKRKVVFDEWAVSAAELVLVFCTIVLITGPLWGRKAWGVFWVWDPRLTSTFILWLTFVAYHAMRRFSEGRDTGRRIGAGLAILAAIDVPIIHFSVELWGGQHPIVMQKDGFGSNLHPEMEDALWATLTFEALLFVTLLLARVGAERTQNRVHALEVTRAMRSNA